MPDLALQWTLFGPACRVLASPWGWVVAAAAAVSAVTAGALLGAAHGRADADLMRAWMTHLRTTEPQEPDVDELAAGAARLTAAVNAQRARPAWCPCQALGRTGDGWIQHRTHDGLTVTLPCLHHRGDR